MRDPSIGSVYYYNHETQQSQWDIPVDFAALHRVKLQSTLIGAAFGMSGHHSDATGDSGRRDSEDDAAWQQVDSEYTGADGVEATAEDSLAAAGVLYTVGEWQAFLDPDTQCSYFYNTVTQVCEWEPPAEVVQYLAGEGHVHADAGEAQPYDPKVDPNFIGTIPSPS